MVSDNLARAVVSAIVADNARALKRAWLAFGAGVPQDLASKFVKQAWNHDRAMHPSTAALLEGEHMLATIYTTIADLIPEASEQSHSRIMKSCCWSSTAMSGRPGSSSRAPARRF